jgi:DNA-binding CsgD family transcriptional regulator/AraC-like DNA-binding protein
MVRTRDPGPRPCVSTGGIVLVARRNELRELGRLLGEVAAGAARCAVVTGPVAIGKTTLLEAFCRSARRAGAHHLAAKATPPQRQVPLGVIRQLLGELDATPVGAPAPSATGTTEPTYRRPPVPQRLVTAVTELARSAPVVVSVDDAQHADPESTAILRELMENPPDARIMIVIAEAPESGTSGTGSGFDVEALPGTTGTCLRLGLLDEDGVRAALIATTGSADDRTVHDLHRTGGGNPLLTRALITDLVASPDPRLPSFRRAVARCLERSSPAALPVARAAAVLSTSGANAVRSATALHGMLISDPTAMGWALADLRATGLFDHRNEFRHDAARALVLDGIPPELFEEFNTRALQVLLSEGVSSRHLARHVAMAGRARTRWEVDVLLEAADQALASDDVEEALEDLRLAEAGPAARRQRHRIAAASVRVWLRTNPGAVRVELGALVDAFTEGELDDTDAGTLLRALGWNGEVDRIAEIVERSGQGDRTQLGLPFVTACRALVSRYPTIRAVIEAMHGRTGPLAVSMPEAATPQAAESALLGVPDDEDLVAGAMRFLAMAPLTDATIDRIELALTTAVARGHAREVRGRCDELLAEADRRGARTWTATLLALRAEIALRLGDLHEAHRLAERSIETMPGRSWGVAVCAPLATSVCSAIALGDHAAAALRLETPVPNSAYMSRFGLQYLQARGRYYEATGQMAAALGDFRFCATLVREWELDDPSVVPWRTDLARVHLRMGEPQQARELLDEQLARAPRDDFRTCGEAMLLRAETVDGPARTEQLLRAAELLRRAGDRFLLEKAEVALGRVAPPGAAHPAPALPPDTLDAAAAGSLADAGSRRVLTDCELRVAELAAQGRSNKEISRQAFITVSTVEQHLTKVYRKLRIRGRSELSASLGGGRLSVAMP